MADNRIAFGPDENKVPQQKRFLQDVSTNVCKSVFVDYADGEKQTTALFGRSGVFLAPKHTDFVRRFLRQTIDKRSWYNLNLPRDRIVSLLLNPDWYRLFIPATEMEFTRFDQVQRWEEIAVALLKKYIDRYWR